MENWRKFVKEAMSPKDKEAVTTAGVKALKAMGGAGEADGAIEKIEDDELTKVDTGDLTPEELEQMLLALKKDDGSPQVVKSTDGDLINTDGLQLAAESNVSAEDLNEAIEIFLDAKDELLDEKKKRKKRKGKKKKKKGKKDACYHKVRARYSVWPSAYASGALVKCRKVGASNWGNKSKKKKK
jgi:hypothetical protein